MMMAAVLKLWEQIENRSPIEEQSCTISSRSVFETPSLAFYRAMHYSAKRGPAIACRPSVCLWLWWIRTTYWKAWNLIARTISPTPSLFAAQRTAHLLRGEHGEIWVRAEVGWEKMAFCSTKAAISLKRVKIEKKLLWRAYRNSPSLFRTVPYPRPPTASSFPRLGVRNPHPKLQSLQVDL